MIGIVLAWNEADCVGNAVRCLLESEHEVHVFQHGSDPDTAEAIAGFGDEITVYSIDRKRVEFWSVFAYISRWINRQSGHEWVTFLAADSILFPPSGEQLKRSHVEEAMANGVEVINPTVRCFWITDADDQDEADYLKRLKHFATAPGPNIPCNSPCGWLLKLTGTMPHGLHRVPWAPSDERSRAEPEWPGGNGAGRYWPKGTMISFGEWRLDHYPVRSVEQGLQKARSFPLGPSRQRRRYQQYVDGSQSIIKDASLMQRTRTEDQT